MSYIPAILAANTLLLAIAIVNLGPPILFYLYSDAPIRQYLLYVIMPLGILYNIIDPCQKKQGRTNAWFASHFPPFSILRRHISLTVSLSSPKTFRAMEAKPGAQFIYAIFPHGVGSDFRVLLQGMLPEFLPNTATKVRSLAASVLFTIPLLRFITLMTGCVDASRATAVHNLKAGNSLIVLPGGEAEQLMTQKGVELIYVKKRKGFVRLGMLHNVPVTPVYVFGCNDLYVTMRGPLFPLRQWLMKNLHVCLPPAKGLYGTYCPFPVKNTIVFGDPVLYTTAKPGVVTPEELDKAHEQFIASTKALFDKHKTRLGYGDRELVVV